MKFGANRSQLYDAQKTARVKWEAACDAWADEVRRDFAEEVWEPLDNHVSEVLRSIDHVSTTFARIRSECEFLT